MALRFLLLLGAYLYAEFTFVAWVGDRIGAFSTLLAMIGSALAGAAIARHQGMGVIARVQESMAKGEFPAQAMLDGACLLLAAFLLVVPGFLSDILGVLLLLPPVRLLMGAALRNTMQVHTVGGGAGWGAGWSASGQPRRDEGVTVDVTYQDTTRQPLGSHADSAESEAPGTDGTAGTAGTSATRTAHGTGSAAPHADAGASRAARGAESHAAHGAAQADIIIDAEVVAEYPASGSGAASSAHSAGAAATQPTDATSTGSSGKR